MTTEGLLSLCHALKRVEAAAAAAKARGTLTRRLRLPLDCPANRSRPQLIELKLEKKPIQTTFDWPSNQLRLFKGVG
jgi:hypothetical protein